jgi:type VI secretion system VasD/TssJ family lipoprotein
LGNTLVAEKSVMLAPDSQETVSLPAVKGGAYLAYVAAYRDLSHSTWSLVVPVNPLPLIGASVNVMVSANSISLSQ